MSGLWSAHQTSADNVAGVDAVFGEILTTLAKIDWWVTLGSMWLTSGS